MTTEQLVVFSILMESGSGILGKSPKYIQEKFGSCSMIKSIEVLRGLLDMRNQAKLNIWLSKWGPK